MTKSLITLKFVGKLLNDFGGSLPPFPLLLFMNKQAELIDISMRQEERGLILSSKNVPILLSAVMFVIGMYIIYHCLSRVAHTRTESTQLSC